MNGIDVRTADPRDFTRDVVNWMVDELQARIGDVETEIDSELTNLRRKLGITMGVARFLRALAKRGRMTHNALASVSAAKGIDELTVGYGDKAPKIVHVYATKARQALSAHGHTLTSIWGEGYEAPVKTRTFLKAVMRGETPTKDTSHED